MKKKHPVRNVVIGLGGLLTVFGVWFVLYFKLDPTDPQYYASRGGVICTVTKVMVRAVPSMPQEGDTTRYIFWHDGEDPNRESWEGSWKTTKDSIIFTSEDEKVIISNLQRNSKGEVTAKITENVTWRGKEEYLVTLTSFWALERYIRTTTG